MITTVKSSIKNIFRKKVMSILTIAGVGIGVMSVVVISFISNVGSNEINNELASMGIGGMMIRASNSGITLSEEELSVVSSMEEVQYASPLITSYAEVIVKQVVNDCVIWGVNDDTKDIVSLEIVHGRMINESDINSSAKVCVVDENFALSNYYRSNIVGKTISIYLGNAYHDFQIIGITKTGGNLMQNLMGDVVPAFTYVPYSTMQNFSQETGFSQMIMTTGENTNIDEFTNSINANLDKSLGTSDSVIIDDLNKQKDNLNAVLSIITLILTVIAGISLVVAGLSIMTVMLVSISERTREIGIKKSIGARNITILIEFLTESIIITSIGAGVGALFGVTLGVVGCIIVGVSVIINVKTVLFSVAFAILVGSIFGVYPAYKAAKLKPVDALRYE